MQLCLIPRTSSPVLRAAGQMLEDCSRRSLAETCPRQQRNEKVQGEADKGRGRSHGKSHPACTIGRALPLPSSAGDGLGDLRR